MKRIAVCGYHSLPYGTNTAGDIIVRQEIVSYLASIGYDCDIITDELVHVIDPLSYDAMVFICGPLVDTPLIVELIEVFSGIKCIAVNVSILDNMQYMVDYFDAVIPRDSLDRTRLDLALGCPVQRVPVAGVILVGNQREYATCEYELAKNLVLNSLAKTGVAPVMIDTKLPNNEYGLSSVEQIDSVVSKMDIVITTRLHGAVFSIRNNVPFVGIDQIVPEGKMARQLRAMGWKPWFHIASLDEATLSSAIEFLLTDYGRKESSSLIAAIKQDFIVDGANTLDCLKRAINEESIY